MKRANHAGFTLLELVMVLVILSIAAALSYPSLSRGTASLELRAAGRDVLNCLRYAREKAITEQTRMKVVVDRESKTVVLSTELEEDARSYVLPEHVAILRLSTSSSEILEGPLVVRFLPNGSASDGEIVLRSRTGGVLGIVTDPITGGARLLTAQRELNR